MNLKQHAVLTLLALLCSIAAVSWFGFNSDGTIFVTTGFIVLFNAVAAIIPKRRP